MGGVLGRRRGIADLVAPGDAGERAFKLRPMGVLHPPMARPLLVPGGDGGMDDASLSLVMERGSGRACKRTGRGMPIMLPVRPALPCYTFQDLCQPTPGRR